MDIEFVGQLIDTMEEGVNRLEQAIAMNDKVMTNKLRIFIFDIHKKIGEAMEGDYV